MRALFFLIVLAGIGYLGWNYYQGNLPLPQTDVPEDYPRASTADSAVVLRPATPAPPAFQSRIRSGTAIIRGDKKIAPAGSLYMLERVTAETKNGIVAAVPGDEVKLVQRKGEKLRVSLSGTEFEVRASQVTDDLAVAEDAERKDFLRRNGQL